MRKRAMNTEKARHVRQQGHDDALEFAHLIGLKQDYQNDARAKKDVVDFNGDTHSLKSGEKRWQIFLYGKGRLETDYAFQAMNGIGQLLLQALCIYPDTYEEYQNNKLHYKQELQVLMRALKNKFQEKHRVQAFLNKAMFNGGEVNYLTIKHDKIYHVFDYRDVVDCMSENFTIINSLARNPSQISEQKVIFKYKGFNAGELEIRNSGSNHYREVLFVMNKLRIVRLLFDHILKTSEFNEQVHVYGHASRKFKK